ncbi:MAG: peptidyl-prolyl cis-trans isomerase, partial [Proteobacteria bacterium]|nr:peptidyl-prolyl cis-trans isomerase [Pseudomonadota bacterium]
FAELAKQYSNAPNASDGGELGLFEISSFPESIQKSVSKLSKGEHTDVISTARGFQIFYLQDIVTDGGKTLEQAYDEIHGLLYDREVEQKFGTWLKALKEKAHIKIMN